MPNTTNCLMELEDAVSNLALVGSMVGQDMREPQFNEAWERFSRAVNSAMRLTAKDITSRFIYQQVYYLKVEAPDYTHDLLGRVLSHIAMPD